MTTATLREMAEELLDKHRWMKSDKLVSIMCEFATEQSAQARAEAVAECIRICNKRSEERFAEHGIREPDTNATYYSGRRGDTLAELDEEDDAIAEAIAALSPVPQVAHSKSEYKRLVTQGANVLPPGSDVPQDCVTVPREPTEAYAKEILKTVPTDETGRFCEQDIVAAMMRFSDGMVPRKQGHSILCGDVGVSSNPRYAGWVFVRHVDGINWTTGAKLTPETWGMLASSRPAKETGE